MDYVKPFTYFVGATGGFTNLLLCGVCNFIPIVGPITLLGYRAEVAEELVRDRQMRRHPAFDFSRFGDYLSRGVWPFLYQLLVGVVAFACIIGGVILVGLLLSANAPKGNPEMIALLVVAGYLLVILLMVLVSAFVLWPMELHAQISRRFAPVEAFGFATRFQGKLWGQTLVSLIVFLFGSTLLSILGLLACYFGLFFAIVVQFMAQQHLMTQLYQLYLDAGGDPIPTPEEEYYEEDDEYDDEPPRRARRRDDDEID